MATSKEFHDYVLENLQKVGVVSTRKMMGECLVYFQDKLFLSETNEISVAIHATCKQSISI